MRLRAADTKGMLSKPHCASGPAVLAFLGAQYKSRGSGAYLEILRQNHHFIKAKNVNELPNTGLGFPVSLPFGAIRADCIEEVGDHLAEAQSSALMVHAA